MKAKINYSDYKFYIINLANWFLFTLIFLLLPDNSRLTISETILFILTGFIITNLLRVIYKSINVQKKPVLLLLIIVTLLSIIFGYLWNLQYNYFSEKDTCTVINFYCLYFIGWSSFYCGIKFLNEIEIAKKEISNLKKEYQCQIIKNIISADLISNSLQSAKIIIQQDMLLALNKVDVFINKFENYFSTNNDFVKIKDEVELLKNVFLMEKRRLGKIFDFTINCDEFLLNKFIKKYLIYSIIKNILYSDEDLYPLTININLRLNDECLLVDISFNGNFSKNDNRQINLYSFINFKDINMCLEHSYQNNYSINHNVNDNQISVLIIIKKNINL